ncbi:unnamed protein product [Clonostachys rhizophaga]|uniref:AMP-dependent synthetase/ligase domain-containing protein n=1 Tax=Clonostachys rhizophaga TaxID=160324 RepID=A0A9N9YTE6_9HYPO|nr:unnamed protein product [Clonostachys rhizophaga]
MSPKDTVALVKELSQPPPPGSPYGVPIPGSERPNRSAVYRHFQFRDKPLLSTLDPEHQTLYDLFENSLRKYPNKRCLGKRNWLPATSSWEEKFDWLSFGQVGERRKNFGAGIVEIHNAINHGKDKYPVGIWSQNRPEWHIADLGLTSQSLFSVSLYETLGPNASEYIVNHAELACIVCSLPHIPTLLKLAPRLPTLKLIVSIDSLNEGEMAGHSKAAILNELAAEHGIKIYSMAEVEEIGLRSGLPARPPVRDDICTINYTSGTTGNPKGVVLTHGNAVAGVAGARCMGAVTHKDSHFSYLPLAHIFGRLMDNLALAESASMGFFHGDMLGLVDDLKLFKPTSFQSVPRLYNRFNSAIRAATVEAEGFRGSLSRRVVDTKKASMKLPNGKGHASHFLYDRIWTPKVKAAIGLDRVHSMVSGSAQLDPDVQEFLGAATGIRFYQGYGLTESHAVGLVQHTNDYSTGNIGPPMPCTEICLESVPEFEYTVHDKPNPRGELLLRGPTIFKEYYKNPEETQKALEPDGWFHTGDIVEIDSLGRVKIIDRKKNVLKLSHGEYVSPERIENVFLGNTGIVNSAFVHGTSKESALVAIFGVDPETFAAWASKVLEETLTHDDLAALKAAACNPKVRKAFLKVLDDIARKAKFNGFERVKNLRLDVEPFSIDNGLLTPTLKLKRPQAAKAFEKDINEMYEEIAATVEPIKSKL